MAERQRDKKAKGHKGTEDERQRGPVAQRLGTERLRGTEVEGQKD